MTVNVYEQYFEAECTVNGTERHGALIALTADSEAGMIRYEVLVTFFPHTDEEDYAVSYDACYSRVIYEAKGRRSAKRERAMLETLRETADSLAAEADGTVFWQRPLREARYG